MNRSTLARREPLTVGASAPAFCAVAAGLAVAGAASAALLGGGATSWGAETVALALVAAAAAALVVGAGPFLAPFRGWTHALVLVLLLLAAVLDDLAHAGGRPALLDAPALITTPLVLLALAVLRPPAEVLGGGALLAGATTAATAALAPWTPLTPARLVAVAGAGLASALAAAAFGRVALRALDRPTVASPAEARPAAVRLSVQQETVARLEAEAIPLLTRVAGDGALTAADRTRAGDIADRLRAAMVADLARGWLVEAGLSVDDRHGYGERMSTQQRTALRTALAALPLVDPERPGRATVHGQDHDAQVRLELPLRARPDRRRLAALVPLLRSAYASADLRVEQHGGRTTAVLVAAWAVERASRPPRP